ncbi:hypothetical protein Tsubulata_016435 [Turnera subulata]|uniref:3'-5' exonuclease domain-containing protein n=1 Tax=Turnera subulata TaxID=218843 RepID=A0A9Q0F2Z7_9ROSI|nr:hypothetical protein Tsubulata_016435 [Turnera subulata]
MTTNFSQRGVKIPGAEGIECDVLVTSEPESIARWIFNFLVKHKVMLDDAESYTALLEQGVFSINRRTLGLRSNHCVIAALDIDLPVKNHQNNNPDGVPLVARKVDTDIPIRGPYGALFPPLRWFDIDWRLVKEHQKINPDAAVFHKFDIDQLVKNQNNKNKSDGTRFCCMPPVLRGYDWPVDDGIPVPDDDGIPVPPPVLKLSGLDPTTNTVTCAIFQFQAGKEIPVCLRSFLQLSCMHFLMENPDKLSYLKRSLNLGAIKAYDLQRIAAHKYKDDTMSLEQLLHRAAQITTYVKPAAVVESDWSGPLTPTQCIYAAADCYWIMHLLHLLELDQWAE